MQTEINRALEWLKSPIPHRKFAGCVLLKHMANNIPTFFFVKVKEFFDLIWLPLHDKLEEIRISAVMALSNCLQILKQRLYRLEWYTVVYNQMLWGLDPNNHNKTEVIHGSLLIVGELLKHTGMVTYDVYKYVCNM